MDLAEEQPHICLRGSGTNACCLLLYIDETFENETVIFTAPPPISRTPKLNNDLMNDRHGCASTKESH